MTDKEVYAVNAAARECSPDAPEAMEEISAEDIFKAVEEWLPETDTDNLPTEPEGSA